MNILKVEVGRKKTTVAVIGIVIGAVTFILLLRNFILL